MYSKTPIRTIIAAQTPKPKSLILRRLIKEALTILRRRRSSVT
jgi:hypothetical protein